MKALFIYSKVYHSFMENNIIKRTCKLFIVQSSLQKYKEVCKNYLLYYSLLNLCMHVYTYTSFLGCNILKIKLKYIKQFHCLLFIRKPTDIYLR